MKKEAVLHIPMSQYAHGLDEKHIVFRLRCAKGDLKSCTLYYGDTACRVTPIVFTPVAMKVAASDLYHDYWQVVLDSPYKRLYYYFHLNDGTEQVLYYGDVFTDHLVDDRSQYFKLPFNHRADIAVVPDWVNDAVVYNIFPDSFASGVKRISIQDRAIDYHGQPVRSKLGGTLWGIADNVDYLEELGVNCVYLNPIFVAGEYHKYDLLDYFHVDPCFGGDKALHHLVRVLHARGIRILIDGVFNHCGSFNKWMDRERIYENAEGYEKGAFICKESPYHDYFQFYNENAWPYNTSYDGWWGHDTLPKLNYEKSRELFDYVMKIAAKWVSPPYNVDGWRLDVAADLGHSPEFNHYFWKEFRKAVRSANPDAIVLAEHYGNPIDWLNGKEWDTVMNYDAFMEPVTWFLTGMQKHSDDYRGDLFGNADSFMGAMRHHMASFTAPSLQIAMNELSNHDHSRFLTRTNKKVGRVNTLGAEAANQGVNKAVMREAVLIQMTWPGAPTIYYGDEAGVCGFTDPDNRRTYPWGHEDQELIRFHKEMIRIHKEHEEILTGSLKYIEGDYNVLGYGRFNRRAMTVVMVNNNDHEITREVSIWHLGIPKESVVKRLMFTTESGYDVTECEYPVVGGKITLTLPKTSAIILHYERKEARNSLLFG